MAKAPQFSYSMFGFKMSFMRFYNTVPMYFVEGKYLVTLPSGYFAASAYEDEMMYFVDFYWKSRVN